MGVCNCVYIIFWKRVGMIEREKQPFLNINDSSLAAALPPHLHSNDRKFLVSMVKRFCLCISCGVEN